MGNCGFDPLHPFDVPARHLSANTRTCYQSYFTLNKKSIPFLQITEIPAILAIAGGMEDGKAPFYISSSLQTV